MLRDLVTGLLDLLAPPTCAACRAPLDVRSQGFCEGCRLLIDPWPCRAQDALDRDACVYGGPLRDALHRLKYQGATELAPVLARWLERPAAAWLGQLGCVAVVPLHPRRLRARGYTQSALLARPLARALGLPFMPRLLARVRDTDAQVGKLRRERKAHLAGAFVASAAAAERAVLVLDDVRTTGATFEEARRALTAAGARAVYTLALARADDRGLEVA
jgi:ComF family protein